MKKLILLLLLCVSLAASAGRCDLADGSTSAYWSDTTETIIYNSYRVEVKLTDTYSKNVWGDVTLFYNGKKVDSRPFMINSGDMRADVDFDNLQNGVRYEVRVNVRGK